jgi:hypothetical protein
MLVYCRPGIKSWHHSDVFTLEATALAWGLEDDGAAVDETAASLAGTAILAEVVVAAMSIRQQACRAISKRGIEMETRL